MIRQLPLKLLAGVLAEGFGGSPGVAALALLTAPELVWDRVLANASEEHVLPALAATVAALGLVPRLPPTLSEFLAAVHAANLERNQELRGQLRQVVGLLNCAGLRPVLLKGAIRLIDDLYPDIGWRTMRDLDLLVPTAGLEEAVAVLHAAGYRPAPNNAAGDRPWFANHHHYPRLKLPGQLAPVELHIELFIAGRGRTLLGGAEVIAMAAAVERDGVAMAVPAADHQFVHLVGHCQISSRGYACGLVALRDLLEAAYLMGGLQGTAAKAAILRFTASRHRRSLATFLAVQADTGFGGAGAVPPLDLLARLQRLRVALQSRSRASMAIGFWLGWRSVQLQQLSARVVGTRKWPHIRDARLTVGQAVPFTDLSTSGEQRNG